MTDIYVRFQQRKQVIKISYDITLFREQEPRTEEITIRLTRRQKERILEMSRNAGKPASRWIISLIDEEHKRQMSECLNHKAVVSDKADTYDDSDPPF